MELAHVVMPGLDPGIPLLARRLFAKRMDCRVKPGNDNLELTDVSPMRDSC